MNRIDLCLYSESRRRQYGVVESGTWGKTLEDERTFNLANAL
ncbi:hypothetical protein FOXG_18120 [Fusarium oxysporum f. sp. lycopersici 4287]|uniref:Uncharacterized protein n=3 Tax=Fusarium oxysporum TaxID=5507 RepID=W9J3S0_FUSOX|nr:hypothetical protein FOXG_18120 [Fusarium oxysporum f. sp. lycopersici 4287]EWY99421.1 hypothetical protein FOYG_03463 [Fusarium oxysporum NRRL 32931]EXK42893.1 hypothetical protein FOMG_05639 [Fusarium oxysporum f. sp. melonis 26406]KNA96240.1 hypothetical protein FOXG_18120 [Fusarium oxysporum f. sp. lycopersici 4287]